MSEEVPQTIDGAIRGFITAIAFTFVLLGGEIMKDAEVGGGRFWLGVALALAGLPGYCAAALWPAVKQHFNGSALTALARPAATLGLLLAFKPQWLLVGSLTILAVFFFFLPAVKLVPQPTIITQPKLIHAEVPSELLSCAPQPLPPKVGAKGGPLMQSDVALYLLDVADAGDDCRIKLDAVRKLVTLE